jgi:hypothetical protein
MSLFNTVRVTVTPRASGAYVNGLWTSETGGTTYEITGSWQPATPREVLTLPEGRRERAAFSLYTASLLNTMTGQNPDRLTVGGHTYEVVRREDHQNGCISHYKYLAVEI